ncbi:hypothetical protein BKA61DRAFT_709145 [Leptodontidium sp. MPI-SDFR-AT-0119]|nr:hypothetical protein BKA61DRAFT_709145 [Leptodontidium sp. MPI-SDFR-AT-0119]
MLISTAVNPEVFWEMGKLLQMWLLHLSFLLSLMQVTAVSMGAVHVPQVTPGSGLPSLASLNLTSEQLYAIPVPDFGKPELKLAKRAAGCFDSNRQCTLDDAVACYNYLGTPGTQSCQVDINGGAGSWKELCRAGNCVVEGRLTNNFIVDSTACSNVAYAVSVIAYTCNPTTGHAGAGYENARNKSNIAIRMYW